MKTVLSFDDVLIVPTYSTVTSRKDCETFVWLSNLSLGLPLISSNMDTITESEMAKAMNENGGVGALHRFCTIEENVNMFMKSPNQTFVSIGVGDKEFERAQALYNVGARNFILDIAHGASLQAVTQYKNLRRILGDFNCHIMVGNFATGLSIGQFEKELRGAQLPDSYKIGVGSGSMCLTRIATGCGLPTLASLLDCKGSTVAPLVADGGIKNSGDIAKALAAGATAVMVGGILAGTDETPGEIINEGSYEGWHPTYVKSEFKYKKYRGSASKESYEAQGKTASHRAPEGDSTLVSYKGQVGPVLQELKAGLQSAMSYVGARTIKEFQENAKLVQITVAGIAENGAHGKK
jgi:IMP dehydrogenase